MDRERLYLYDTTLRDGQQTQGVQFSTAEKLKIAAALDAPGLGELPIWVPLVLSLAFAFTIDGKVKKLRKK
mgnify:CR=1 FL=1